MGTDLERRRALGPRRHVACSRRSRRSANRRSSEGLIYVGTDDGLIQVTEDGGKTWRKIDKIAGVPDYFFVNKIKASKHDKDTVSRPSTATRPATTSRISC